MQSALRINRGASTGHRGGVASATLPHQGISLLNRQNTLMMTAGILYELAKTLYFYSTTNL